MGMRERFLGLCKLKINVICLREAGGDEVWTWMGEILLGFISPCIRPMLHSSLHLPITVSAQRSLQTPV